MSKPTSYSARGSLPSIVLNTLLAQVFSIWKVTPSIPSWLPSPICINPAFPALILWPVEALTEVRLHLSSVYAILCVYVILCFLNAILCFLNRDTRQMQFEYAMMATSDICSVTCRDKGRQAARLGVELQQALRRWASRPAPKEAIPAVGARDKTREMAKIAFISRLLRVWLHKTFACSSERSRPLQTL